MKMCFQTVALLLVYWLFAGDFSTTEAVAMTIPLAAAVGLNVLMRRVAERPLEFRAPWAGLVMRTSASICKDSIKVGLFLARSLMRYRPRPAGSIMRQPFRFGDNSPREAARRALVTLAISASADRYVIDVSPDRDLLEHSLAGGPIDSDLEWPV